VVVDLLEVISKNDRHIFVSSGGFCLCYGAFDAIRHEGEG
jgi:hypothetical protein